MKPFNEQTVLEFYKRLCQDKQHRYKSWEHCYVAFKEEDDTELLSLHLGFYLASWGMYRGSSGLLQKDFTVHKKAIEILKSSKYTFLNTHVHKADRKHISLILELKNELKQYYETVYFLKGNREFYITPTDTLMTKIMLGTLGCIPAYDRYYIDGLREVGLKGYRVNQQSLKSLFDFIEETYNKKIIQETQNKISKNGICYPKMKILDMFFWEVGFEANKRK